jgi:drug/metabolite transporter (DMT)-like permease
MLLIAIILISILEASSQAALKAVRVRKENIWFFVGALGYVCIAALLYYSYQFQGMGPVNLMWSSLSIILAVLFGHVFFGEKITANIMASFVFAILAVTFAYRG